jgi:hypothetical protein
MARVGVIWPIPIELDLRKVQRAARDNYEPKFERENHNLPLGNFAKGQRISLKQPCGFEVVQMPLRRKSLKSKPHKIVCVERTQCAKCERSAPSARDLGIINEGTILNVVVESRLKVFEIHKLVEKGADLVREKGRAQIDN